MTSSGDGDRPLRLVRSLGRGGMGEVWLAEHGPRRRRVAVKVVPPRAGDERRFLRAFHDEVRAVAALDHPAVARVYDLAEVPADAGWPVQPGSPYMVMELASGGSLGRSTVPASFGWLRDLLLALLDALGHTHARGLVHRDLKPSNVLLCTADDARPGPKLADFGVARLLDSERAHTDGAFAGTPHYMAPEQVRGELDAQGPWTDLYALGCLAWTLATGHPPFSAWTGPALLYAQLHHDPPRVPTRISVPDGFEAWLRALLRKDWRLRPAVAADAADALRALRPVDDDVGAPGVLDDGDTFHLGLASVSSFETLATGLGAPVGSRVPGEAAEAPELPPARPPATWRSARPPTAPERLAGSGLGLVGIRAAPIVGREREQDALWDALGRVRSQGRPRVVLVRGAPGLGRTRLLRWIAERAWELGAARAVIVGWDADGAPRLDEALRWADRRAGGPPQGPASADEPRGERNVRHEAVLRRLGRGRAALLCCDDVHWGLEGLELVRWLLDRPGPLPVLAVLSVRDDLLNGLPEARDLVASLGRHAAVESIELSPLSPEARAELLRAGVGLDPESAALLDARSQGDPLVLLELLADQVRRGALEATPAGFRFRAADVTLPADLVAMWDERVQALIAASDAAAREALEAAAALGRDVDDAEWADLVPDDAAREAARAAVLDAGLGKPVTGGWTIASEGLRERIADEARRAGRWQALHRRCAALLQERGAPRERVAHHLRAAGRSDDAAPLLHAAAESALEREDLRTALRLLREGLSALDEAGASERDPRRGDLELLRVDALSRTEVDPREVVARAEALLARARAFGWTRPRARVAILLAFQRGYVLGEPEAWALLDEAEPWVRALGDPALEVSLASTRAVASFRTGDLAGARRGFARALRLAAVLPASTRVDLRIRAAVLEGRTGRVDRARVLVDEALTLLGADGAPQQVGRALVVLADVLDHEGQHEAAVSTYARAAERLDAAGSVDAIYARLGQVEALARLERWEEAAIRARRVRSEAESANRMGPAVRAAAVRARCGVQLCDADLVAAEVAWLERASVEEPGAEAAQARAVLAELAAACTAQGWTGLQGWTP